MISEISCWRECWRTKHVAEKRVTRVWKWNPPQRGQGPQGGRGGFSGNARGPRRDDSLVGCVQKVKKGPWKGYRGKVRRSVPVAVILPVSDTEFGRGRTPLVDFA